VDCEDYNPRTPHAVTQIANGVSTTTYAYDNNGNLTSAGTGTATTSYSYDYANRLIAILYNNATTSTYGYDAFGARVYQVSASTSAATTTYPFKFYSIASTTKSSTNFATSTEYVFNGDTLLATVDQAFRNGSATGTAATYYVHPDHLGSTNVITNASGTVISTKDYYPYGSVRVNSGSASLKRGYIGEFSDTSNLSYLNARYMDPSRGQFLSQDPTFLALGNPGQLQQLSRQSQQQFLTDPQQLNSYSYARDNPIIHKDPNGNSFAASMGLGYALGWESGPYDIFVGSAIGLTLFSAEVYYDYTRGAPGNLQAVKLVQGSGPNTDPEFNGKLPPGWFGRLVKTTLFLGGLGIAAEESGLDRFLGEYNPNRNTNSLPQPFMVSGLSSGGLFQGGLFSNPTTGGSHTACGLLCYQAPTALPSGTPSSSGGGGVPSSSGTAPSGGSSSNNGGWGSTHSACGTLCS
jgi:RHS repeat-associated protein